MGGQDIITVAVAVAALVYVILRVRRVVTGRSDCRCRCGKPNESRAKPDPGRPSGVSSVPLIPLEHVDRSSPRQRNGTPSS